MRGRAFHYLVLLGIVLGPAVTASVTWHNSLPQGDDLRAVDGGLGRYVAVGGASRIMTGAGSSWTVESHGEPTVYHDVSSPNAGVVVAAGEYGRVCWLVEGEWLDEQVTGGDWLYGAAALPSGEAWVCGDGGAIYRYNGANWGVQSSGTSSILNDVDAAASDLAWACSATGSSYRYNGTSWSRISTGSTRFLRSVDVLDSDHVWIAGDRGTILFYNGSSFTTQTTGVTSSLYAVRALGPNDVWAAGSGPVLLHDDGTGWQEVAFPYDETPRGLDPSGNGILVAGDRGLLARYTWDRGWERLDSAPWGRNRWNALERLPDGRTMVVGNQGSCLLNDGGWSSVPVPGDAWLQDVTADPSGLLLACGLEGVIQEWTGSAWQSRSSGTDLDLFGLFILNGNRAWAVGGGIADTCGYFAVSTYNAGTWSAIEETEAG